LTILVAPDKFKGSLKATEVCQAVTAGLLQIDPKAMIESVPLADGGEGTCQLLTEWYNGTEIHLTVQGPLFTPVSAYYGISEKEDTAFIEMAVASGLTLLKPEERNPLLTTTFGTGEMIADALKRKVKKIVVGLGGSATNDAGIGMATALGYRFCDAEGEELKPTGENLIHIHHIETKGVHPLLKEAQVVALCDVTNPLFGPEGAAHVYGAQKGGSEQDLVLLDAGLRNFRRVVHKYLKSSVDFPGAGAAGGLGAGAKVFLNAAMEKGIAHIIQTTDLVKKIMSADLVVTGEGKVDDQTFSGKVVSEVLRLAEKAGKPVVVICGKSEVSQKDIRQYGMTKLITLVDDVTSSQSAIEHASTLITTKIETQCRNMIKL
jgi:glycerate kinase